MFDYRLPETKEFDEFRSEDVVDTFKGLVEEGDGLRFDQCLAGMVVLADLKGARKSGSIHWGGATSCEWVCVSANLYCLIFYLLTESVVD